MVFAGVYNAAKLYNIPLVVWEKIFHLSLVDMEKTDSNASNLYYRNDLLKDKKLGSFIDKIFLK